MHDYNVANATALPLLWTPTTGNIIPPHAIPLGEGPCGQLYIARGLLWGEMHIGSTSYASSQGATLYDGYGRSHMVFEYEVLTCATSLRFHLETPQPLTLVADTARPTPRLPVRRESVSTTRTVNLSPKTLAPFPWLISPHNQPANIPDETTRRRHEIDPPPYMSPKGGWVEVPKHSPLTLSGRENVQFEHLTQSKCFLLIDDTASMQSSWSQTRAALSGTVDILSSNAKWEGLDVRFLHHAHSRRCVKTREEFESVFNSVAMWRGEKRMAAEVTQVFEESLSLICEPCNPRPVNLLIITDGIATDAQELFDAIICICHKLKAKCVPPNMFRIHLLQMGQDRKAVQPLHDFRDQITQRERDLRILNVVSFHRGRGLLNAQIIFKLLLASTYIPFEQDPGLGERQPAEVIGAQYGELERIRMIANGRR